MEEPGCAPLEYGGQPWATNWNHTVTQTNQTRRARDYDMCVTCKRANYSLISQLMARFTALPSDTSEDEKYAASPPRKPPQSRSHYAFPPPLHEDADMASDSGSSRAGEEGEGDDEEELPSDSSRLSPDIQRTSGRANRDMYDSEEQGDRDESSDSSSSSLEVPLPKHRRGDPSVIPWAQRIGIDPQKMHVMHASLFPRPESAEAVKQLSVDKPDRMRLTPNGLHRKHSRDSEGDGLRAATQEVCRPFLLSESQNGPSTLSVH
jgi:nuclear pore complex protein Nup98-Nup96